MPPPKLGARRACHSLFALGGRHHDGTGCGWGGAGGAEVEDPRRPTEPSAVGRRDAPDGAACVGRGRGIPRWASLPPPPPVTPASPWRLRGRGGPPAARPGDRAAPWGGRETAVVRRTVTDAARGSEAAGRASPPPPMTPPPAGRPAAVARSSRRPRATEWRHEAAHGSEARPRGHPRLPRRGWGTAVASAAVTGAAPPRPPGRRRRRRRGASGTQASRGRRAARPPRRARDGARPRPPRPRRARRGADVGDGGE